MKIIFKTLTGLSSEIEVEDDLIIIELLYRLFIKKICPEIFNYEFFMYNLILNGKNIKDLQLFDKLSDYLIEEFITIYVTLNLSARGLLIGGIHTESNIYYQKMLESFDNTNLTTCIVYYHCYKAIREKAKELEKFPPELRGNII